MSIVLSPETSTTILSCSSAVTKPRITNQKAIEIILTRSQILLDRIKSSDTDLFYSATLKCVLKQQMRAPNKLLSDRAIFQLFKRVYRNDSKPKFQFELAQMYENGIGCEVNLKRALKHYAKGALLDHTPSLIKIADYVEKDCCVGRNSWALTNIYLKLSQKGVAIGKERICERLFNPGDRPIDSSKAIDFCLSLSSLYSNAELKDQLEGLTHKQTYVSRASKSKENVKNVDDDIKAEIISAIEKIFVDVIDNDPLIKVIVDDLPKPQEAYWSYTKILDQIEPSVRFDLYKYLAESGDSKYMLLLAGLYIQGIGCEKNMEEYNRWLQRAADHNNPQALMVLVAAYAFNGDLDSLSEDERAIVMPCDYKKALEYLKRAIDTGDKDAIDGYQRCFENENDGMRFTSQSSFWIPLNFEDEIPYMMEKVKQGNRDFAEILFEHLNKKYKGMSEAQNKERKELAMKIARESGILEEIMLSRAMSSVPYWA